MKAEASKTLRVSFSKQNKINRSTILSQQTSLCGGERELYAQCAMPARCGDPPSTTLLFRLELSRVGEIKCVTSPEKHPFSATTAKPESRPGAAAHGAGLLGANAFQQMGCRGSRSGTDQHTALQWYHNIYRIKPIKIGGAQPLVHCRSPIWQCDTTPTACPQLDALGCRRQAGSGR